MIKSEEGRIHKEHRKRMRAKLRTHGARIFDTYELLEMLLYYVVPYKDTNPIAKQLLTELGGLDAVLGADEDSLVSVSGIGKCSAELIRLVGEMYRIGEVSARNSNSRVFDDYDDTGNYLVDYFNKNESVNVAALMLDGGMRLLKTVDISGEDFSSAAVRSRSFINEALSTGATIAIIAHSRRYGALFPTASDVETSRMLREDLSNVGVRVAEHFLISGSRYIGLDTKKILRFSNDSPELLRFLDSKKGEDKL